MSPAVPSAVAVPSQTETVEGLVGEVERALSGVPPLAWRIAGAIVVVLVGWYGSRLLVRQFGRPLARRFQRPSLARTVLRSVRALVLVVTGFIALSTLGLEFPDILVSVTVFSAVLGVVLAPIVGSIINGVFVIADQPYEIGDMIELADDGTRGFVEDVTLRYTKVFTLDNTFLVIPNGSIRDRDVINYSAEDERTRRSLDVIVTYESDVGEARRLIERAARDVDGVISGGPGIRIGAARYPAGPTCYIDQFGDHGVHLRLRYWAEQPYKLLTVRSLVQTRIREALADADVEIAYPHQHLVFDETSGRARVQVDGDGPRAPADRDVDRDPARTPEPETRPEQTRNRPETDGGGGPGTGAGVSADEATGDGPGTGSDDDTAAGDGRE